VICPGAGEVGSVADKVGSVSDEVSFAAGSLLEFAARSIEVSVTPHEGLTRVVT